MRIYCGAVGDVLNVVTNARLRMQTWELKLFRKKNGVDDAVYAFSDRPARNMFTARICKRTIASGWCGSVSRT